MRICQSCLKDIQLGEEAIAVSYGCVHWKSGKFYNTRGVDYFHKKCDVAIRHEIRDITTSAPPNKE